MSKSKKRVWKDYPKSKPIESTDNKKYYYYVQLTDQFWAGSAYKCWYHNGHWLCDGFRSIVKGYKFTFAAKNGKHEILTDVPVKEVV